MEMSTMVKQGFECFNKYTSHNIYRNHKTGIQISKAQKQYVKNFKKKTKNGYTMCLDNLTAQKWQSF